MSKFRIAVFAVFIAALSTVPAIARDRDDDHPKDVKVVNTPNVNVVNTPSVNVGALPAVQLAPGTAVGIAGTPSVQIANSPASPVPVRDAGTVNRTPFQTQVTVEIKDADSVGSGFVPVPTGKRLVIEYASVASAAQVGEILLFDIVTQSKNGTQPPVSIRHFLPTTVMGPGPLGGDENQFVAGLVVKLFSDPGTTVEMRAERGAQLSANNAVAIFSISGYFEDAP